ncbi:MAG: hypothetical protein IS860_06655 [Nitrosopumilus sp.]|nr:hypothetical protein [Nitrosopumilus sp.]
MNLYFNTFIISVLILGLISSPLTFAQTSDVENESIVVELEDAISISDETETEETETEETETEETETEETETEENIKNLGQEVSRFVHESRELFKQQKAETKEVIVQCRDDMRNAEPSERQSVREECKSDLQDIRDSYKELRETYQAAFKEFRENMRVFIQESKGLPVSSAQRDAAIANIESLPDNVQKREHVKELHQKMDEQLREDAQQLREEQKRERDAQREADKAEREAQLEADDTDEFEDKLEIEVEVEDGIAKIQVENNGEKETFEVEWINEENTISEIASLTGLTISEIEQVIEFEIELVEDDDQHSFHHDDDEDDDEE